MNNTQARHAIKQLMTMSQEQLDYIAAKALYDKIKGRVEAETKPIHKAMKNGTITTEQWADRVSEIEHWLNYWTIYDQLIDRENDLIAWAKSYLLTHHADRYEQVKEAFESPVILPHLRQKLVDICLKFNANS